MMCGMYIINGVHGPEPRSSEGNTSSNPQVLALIPRPAFNGMERMCQRHGSNQNSHPPVLVRKPLCNQFIHCQISSRGVFAINNFKLHNFVVVAIEWVFFATVDRDSIMARIHRWSMTIYGSLQAEFMETKYNSHIDRYGTSKKYNETNIDKMDGSDGTSILQLEYIVDIKESQLNIWFSNFFA